MSPNLNRFGAENKKMKTQYTNSLKAGDEVDSLFAIRMGGTAKGEDGKFRLNGELLDAKGVIPFVRFGVDEAVAKRLGGIGVVGVRGKVKSNKYFPRQVVVDEFFVPEASLVEASDYEAVAPIPLDDMKKELFDIIMSVNDHSCLRLLRHAFRGDEEKSGEKPCEAERMYRGFLEAPGATGKHHAYKHGLLQHTLDVTRAARAIAESSPHRMDMDVVTTAALLHDIGKVEEYVVLPNMGGFGRSQRGNLMGHIVLGLMLISRYVLELREGGYFDENMEDHILHCIASHHTKRDFGSPVEPMTLEAMAVALADGHDAETSKVGNALRDYIPGQDAVKLGDRFYYVKPLGAGENRGGENI